MAKLQYPDIILKEQKFTALADLSLRLNQQDLSQIMTTLIDLVDDKHIDLLAEKWSATGYDGMLLAESNKNKRMLIKHSVELHRHKGTPWSIREIIRSLGLGEITLDEGLTLRNYDDNTFVASIPEKDRWAYFGVILSRPITNDQVPEVKKVIRNFIPARCILAVFDYKAAPVLYNNKARYNGNYNHGSA
ncbi:phage tail protein [Phocoenobacter skyensis]|uniref:Phage tail protein n=1 Tax=Phocoenobacter skyensis TaxID=97481 RepID=A0ABT9JPM2_9PAST|nr:phage tail protein [Pasteurella skyensis]MDP8080257.1 phage tail protein [Pasteurella skyensis]MDP8086204.1 phage tail protein [Pasteurella skyensis]